MWKASEVIVNNYLAVVRNALNNESYFKVFKSQPSYEPILGEGDPSFNNLCAMDIIKHQAIYSKIDTFSKIDSIGWPPLRTCFREKRRMSPNVLRHLQSICNIFDYFQNITGWIVSEFGVGYGALASCGFMMWSEIKAWHFIDLPEVEDLAIKCNKILNIEKVTKERPPSNPDLFISEYGITEQDTEGLIESTQKYVLGAKNIYIRSNVIDEQKKMWIPMLQEHFDLKIWDEEPKTTRGMNQVIVGRHL